MMMVFGRVTKAGSKIINPDSDRPYLRFFVTSPYRLKKTSYISVNWNNWDWEPKAGDFVRCTGLFELTDGYSGKTFPNLYINGNVDSGAIDKIKPHIVPIVPGVVFQKAPNWSAYPGYKGKEKGKKAIDTNTDRTDI